MNPLLHGLLSVSARLRQLALRYDGAPAVAEHVVEKKNLPAPPPVEPKTETHTTFASPHTRKSLGIGIWRLVVDERERSILVEGIDCHGGVKFSSVIRRNGDQSLAIESCNHRGSFSLAKSADTYLVSNTINLPQWTKFTTAFKSDWAEDKASAAARSVSDMVDLLGRISSNVPRTQTKARVLGGGRSVKIVAAAMLATTSY